MDLINQNRSEQRFIIATGAKDRILTNSPVNLEEVVYSSNPITRTVYIGSEDIVPWGVSFKARKYLPIFSDIDFILDDEDEYVFTIKKVLDKKTETSQKSSNNIVSLKKAIDITSVELGTSVDIYLITEYQRQHFVSANTTMRITWDQETRYWQFNKRPAFLHKEDIERIEIKTMANMITDQRIISLIDIIHYYGGRV